MLRNILSVDFIGRSITEVHLYGDYAEEFKALMLGRLPSLAFVDIDPIDDTLLRNSVAENKAMEAARKYQKRLTRRLEQTPSKAHKRFLQSEIDRTNMAISLAGIGMVDSTNLFVNVATATIDTVMADTTLQSATDSDQ